MAATINASLSAWRSSISLLFMREYASRSAINCIPFIEAAAGSVASVERADAPFAADAPSLRFSEPALLLALATLRTLGAQIGNGDPCHSQLLRGLFVGSGEKSGVACHHARDHAEPLLMLFNRGDQQGRVRGSS